eukprot:TRINITY_DN13997_c0_g1_i3.p1 TRINITY_DN13997_c0_g1~~TRINITY_DN13997_c0_g1_i3.p1  ORF type:complete len:210 (-),score=37.24 TRINITY_DN13997_c0_g1_i3:477-1040(-)
MSEEEVKIVNGSEPEPATKKQRKDFSGYQLNLENLLTKEYECSCLGEILEAPVHALQGIGPKAEQALIAVGVKTVRDMAEWKYFKIAAALVTCLPLSGENRMEGSLMNIDKAVMLAYEKSSLVDVCGASVDALEGLTKEDAQHLTALHIKTIEDLGKLKYGHWATAILELSRFEVMEVVNRELNKLN